MTVRIKDEVGEVKARIRAMSDREEEDVKVEMEEEDVEEKDEDLQANL